MLYSAVYGEDMIQAISEVRPRCFLQSVITIELASGVLQGNKKGAVTTSDLQLVLSL